MPGNSRIIIEAQLQAFITSLPKYCAGKTFTLSGKAYQVADLVTLATSMLNASLAVTAARAAYTESLQAEAKVLATNAEVVREARDTVALMFNSDTTTLTQFALKPRKPRTPLTAEARAAAKAKAEATRKARGTKGKRQNALIHGEVTGVTITPIPTPGTAESAPAATTPTVGIALPGMTPAHS